MTTINANAAHDDRLPASGAVTGPSGVEPGRLERFIVANQLAAHVSSGNSFIGGRIQFRKKSLSLGMMAANGIHGGVFQAWMVFHLPHFEHREEFIFSKRRIHRAAWILHLVWSDNRV